MKAIRFHGPGDARYEEVSTPRPGPDDVLVRVRAVAICATDVELYDGTMFHLKTGMTRYPFIPGHEWSGEVVEIGGGVRSFAPGDWVVGECGMGCRKCKQCLSGHYNLCPDRSETGIIKQPGGMAEFISFPQFFLHKVGALPFDDAAFVEPTTVAINAVKKARITPSDRVAIVGVGPIGLFAVQVAKAYGARQIIAIDRIETRLDLALRLGADITVNLSDGDPLARVAQATDSSGVDVVIEAVGKKEAWPVIGAIVAPLARVVMIGLFAGDTCTVDFDPLVTKEVTVFGSLGGPNVWPEAIALHHQGRIRPGPMISHRFKLENFTDAIAMARRRDNGVVKVLLSP